MGGIVLGKHWLMQTMHHMSNNTEEDTFNKLRRIPASDAMEKYYEWIGVQEALTTSEWDKRRKEFANSLGWNNFQELCDATRTYFD